MEDRVSGESVNSTVPTQVLSSEESVDSSNLAPTSIIEPRKDSFHSFLDFVKSRKLYFILAGVFIIVCIVVSLILTNRKSDITVKEGELSKQDEANQLIFRVKEYPNDLMMHYYQMAISQADDAGELNIVTNLEIGYAAELAVRNMTTEASEELSKINKEDLGCENGHIYRYYEALSTIYKKEDKIEEYVSVLSKHDEYVRRCNSEGK